MTNRLIERAVREFKQRFGQAQPAFVVRAPGRVNLMGGHVDYNDGWVLPVAIERAAYLAVARRPGQRASLSALDLGAAVTFRLSELDGRVTVTGEPLPAWARYPAGVAWALRERGLALHGMDAVLTSDVPIGAGLSSSAAVEVAFATAWQQLGDWKLSPLALALACQRAENRYVGVNCGLMDQFASVHGRAGHALLLDCRTHEWEPVPLPATAAVVVADTKVPRQLGDSEYNQRRAACEEAVRLLKRPLPHIHALRDVSPAEFARHAGQLPELVRKRAQHVVEEIARTLQAVACLRSQDLVAFGAAMNAAHRSLRDLYEVSIPELEAMAGAARELDGCYGVRLTGAGFGGCVVALVAADVSDTFRQELARRYAAATGLTPDIYVSRAGPGAGVIQAG